MTRCSHCGAELSSWEVHKAKANVPPCWCRGVPRGVAHNLSNLAYAALCDPRLSQPVKTHDIVRFVEPHYHGNPQNTVHVALSQSKRICWGGRSLYGLTRHGLLPRVRGLAQAAYTILIAAQRELHFEEVDFVLEQLNYRFNRDSLQHHLRGYAANRWELRFNIDKHNRVWVKSGHNARREFNRSAWITPTHVEFDALLDGPLATRVEDALDERMKRLSELDGTAVHVGGDRIEFR